MKNELAKKLKDAGFPFRPRVAEVNIFPPETFYIPTLEELIEACGENFHCLVFTNNGGVDSDEKFWSAGTSSVVKDWVNGSTPLEAVANLYLALHGKE